MGGAVTGTPSQKQHHESANKSFHAFDEEEPAFCGRANQDGQFRQLELDEGDARIQKKKHTRIDE